MSRQLSITDSQRQSSDRHNLRGAVYLLSGTLVGRDSVPNAAFYWSTHEVTALGQLFKPYLGPPANIARAMGFEPGSQGTFPEVRIPVRNLPFAHAESMVAAVTDDDFRFENTAATLRVAYLRPGQTFDDLADADWTPLILNGFLGPPDEATLDGFILPVYNRGARRNQSLYWPQLPSLEGMRAASGIGDVAVNDAKDVGTMPPVVVGCPTDWIRLSPLNIGVRGFTVSGFDSGSTQVIFRAITVGVDDLTSGNIPEAGDEYIAIDGPFGDYDFPTVDTGRAGLQIHYLYPIYDIVSAVYDEQSKEFSVTLLSGLAADVPRGAYVQQFGPGLYRRPPASNDETALVRDSAYTWTLGNSVSFSPTGGFLSSGGGDYYGASTGRRFGWLFPDGEVRTFSDGRRLWAAGYSERVFDKDAQPWPMYALGTEELSDHGGRDLGALPGEAGAGVTTFRLFRGSRVHPSAPVYFDPLVNTPAGVQEQPEFTSTSTQSAMGVTNYPTGGTGTDNANARDGNDTTVCVVNSSNTVTLTFNDVLPPFANDDTVNSTLHVLAGSSTGAGVRFTSAAGSTEFATLDSVPGGPASSYSFPQATARDYNETVRIVNDAGGSCGIFEVWWEHDLSAEVSATVTRTQDVTLISAAVPVGPVMQYAELVMRAGLTSSAFQGVQVSGVVLITAQPSGNFRHQETVTGSGYEMFATDNGGGRYEPRAIVSGTYNVPYPTSIMVGLHALLGATEGNRANTIDQASYAAAHARFVQDNIRLSFVWTEKNRPKSWTELEQQLGEQSRSFMFYGPSGHQIMYLESASGFEGLPIIQEFRLPGVPGANTIGTGQSLLERTRTTELVNIFDAKWDRDNLSDTYRQSVRAQNDESISDVGERLRDRGDAEWYAHSPWEGNPAFTVPEVVSGIAQFNADRQAFAATRFNLETAWIAHGLDRGSIIRVTYPVARASFRNVTAEVEAIEVSPANGERFRITARSVSKPQKGIDSHCTWADVFDSSGQWSEEILQTYDTWADYWSLCVEGAAPGTYPEPGPEPEPELGPGEGEGDPE